MNSKMPFLATIDAAYAMDEPMSEKNDRVHEVICERKERPADCSTSEEMVTALFQMQSDKA